MFKYLESLKMIASVSLSVLEQHALGIVLASTCILRHTAPATSPAGKKVLHAASGHSAQT